MPLSQKKDAPQLFQFSFGKMRIFIFLFCEWRQCRCESLHGSPCHPVLQSAIRPPGKRKSGGHAAVLKDCAWPPFHIAFLFSYLFTLLLFYLFTFTLFPPAFTM